MNEKRDKDNLHFSLNKSVIVDFNHACIDEELKVASHVIEGLMLLFISDLDIRKRTKEEAINIAKREGAKRLLKIASNNK